jgi:hypothetical protein
LTKKVVGVFVRFFCAASLCDLNPLGQFDNSKAVTKEVKMMMDPNALIHLLLHIRSRGDVQVSLELVIFTI